MTKNVFGYPTIATIDDAIEYFDKSDYIRGEQSTVQNEAESYVLNVLRVIKECSAMNYVAVRDFQDILEHPQNSRTYPTLYSEVKHQAPITMCCNLSLLAYIEYSLYRKNKTALRGG